MYQVRLPICATNQPNIWTDVIQFYNIINSTDFDAIIALDNVSVLKRALGRRGLFVPKSHAGLWHPAIAYHSFKVMNYLASQSMFFYADVEWTSKIGDVCILKYLTDVLDRPINQQCINIAATEGHLEILKHLRLVSYNNPILKKKIWTSCATLNAFENGHIECLKFILEEDSSLWHPSLVTIVHSSSGPMYMKDPQINDRVIDCARYLHDNGFLYAMSNYNLCSILFDKCTLVDCITCLTTYNSFNVYGEILNVLFKRKYVRIVELMVSFAVTYECCDFCGKIETYGGPHLKRCSTCHNTYYCGIECQRLGWKLIHRKKCGFCW